MNNSRRAMIRHAKEYTQKAYELIDIACYQEEDALDNVPENFISNKKYEAMEGYVDALENARDVLDDALDALNSIFE